MGQDANPARTGEGRMSAPEFIIRWRGQREYLEEAPVDGYGRHVWTTDRDKAKRFSSKEEAGEIARRWHFAAEKPCTIVEMA